MSSSSTPSKSTGHRPASQAASGKESADAPAQLSAKSSAASSAKSSTQTSTQTSTESERRPSGSSGIRSHSDPLGRALLDYLGGQRDAAVRTWSSLEDWDLLPASRFFRAGAALPAVERAAMQAARGRVLDLGAGAGCHALSLQRKGLEVAALDASPGACAVMRQRGLPGVHCASWQALLADGIRGAELRKALGRFDTVLALMNGLGLAGRVRQLPDFLQAIGGLLAPGGQLLLDSADVQYLFLDADFAGGEDCEGSGNLGPAQSAAGRADMPTGPRYMDLSKDHYGECSYRMVYRNADSGLFPWMFLDFPTLQRLADGLGWSAEMLHEDRFFGYLARLQPRA